VASAEPCTAGVSVLDLLASLEEIVGKQAVERAKTNAPPEVRRELEGITAISWVRNVALGQLIDLVAQAAGVEAESMLDEGTRRAVDRSFKTVWRVFLRLTSDEALIARTPTIYSKSRNVGRLESRLAWPGLAQITLSDWPEVTPRQVRTIGIGIARVVELCGRKDVQIHVVKTANGAEYKLTWTA
jgi:hypothetical protein